MKRLALAAAVALLASPALADRLEAVCQGSELVNSGSATICAARAEYRFRSDGPEVEFFLTLRAPETHCSDVVYTAWYPGENWSRGFTRQLRPGESDNVVIGRGYGPGEAVVHISAIGIVGGCNTGVMQSWAVDVSASPVP
ncbi:MAG: hypothetical protein MUE52_12550 [Tabrizicola sp.]|jgi:hypothetical protein|nr:hypothetical protein [Tabrizicola sp.]